MSDPAITTQKALRDCFWTSNPDLKRKGKQKQNAYPTDVRVAWVDYAEMMQRDGQISDGLAQRATL